MGILGCAGALINYAARALSDSFMPRLTITLHTIAEGESEAKRVLSRAPAILARGLPNVRLPPSKLQMLRRFFFNRAT